MKALRSTIVLLAVAVSGQARGDVIPAPTELPAQLSLDAALEIFHTRGLDLLIAEANTLNAEGAVLIAGAVPNPVISATVGKAITYSDTTASQNACLQSGASCSPWSNNLTITDSAAIEDAISGKRDLRLRVARNALAAAKMSRVDAERTLVFQVKQAYALVAQAVRAYKFAKDVVGTQVVTLKKFRERRRAGDISEGDLERVEVQKLEADQARDSAEQTLRNARIALAFLLGVRGVVPDFEVDVKVLDYVVPPKLATASEAMLLRHAFEHRPDLLALGYQRQSADAQLHLVRRQRFPDLTLGLGYSFGGFGGFSTNGPIQGNTISVSLSLPLPVFYHLEGEHRQAKAQLALASLQEAKQTAQVASDIANGLAAFATNRKLVERMEGPRREDGGILESARDAYVHTEQQYDKGKASLTDLLDALRTYIATKNEYFADLAAYWTAVYQIEAAVGGTLR
jgi:cobalt-zinc-cadmium efflux system outer membrane protein